MIPRRTLLAAAATVLGVATPVSLAQTAGRVYRLGILRSGSEAPASDPQTLNAFTTPLRELGYLEGRNLLVERRHADGRLDRLPALARELLALKVDIVLAIGGLAARTAKETTATTPIVFIDNSDPARRGWCKAWPDRGVTSPEC